MSEALTTFISQAQAGINCSYWHIVNDVHSLGAVASLAGQNIVAFFQAVIK